MRPESLQVSMLERQKEGLNGKLWEKYSISIWDLPREAEEIGVEHPSVFPLELCRRLIELYTIKNDIVFDPFAGSGTTLVASMELGRNAVGIDLNPSYAKLAKSRLQQRRLSKESPIPRVYRNNAERMHKILQPDSVDLIITSPPYWNILNRKRTADGKKRRAYSNLAEDLGNASSYPKFLASLGSIFLKMNHVLKLGKRCALVIMDLRIGRDFIPLHIDAVEEMRKAGFRLENIIIWDRRKEYNNLRPLGFPTVFIVNKVHEYIMIFKKVDSMPSYLLA